MSPASRSVFHQHSGSAQLWPLVQLRWAMIRSPGARWGIALLTLIPVALVGLGLRGIAFLPEEQSLTIALATPTLYVGFLFLAVIAPLAAGGGHEFYPSEQLVAYPLRPATVFRSTLLLAPANLAWLLNVMALVMVTSYAVGPVTWGTLRAIVSVLAFVALATVVGQGVAWLVVGVRQSRRGRQVTWLLAAALGIAVVVILHLDLAFRLLDNSPTVHALLSATNGYQGRYLPWLASVTAMVIAAAGCATIGGWVTGWALRRPGDHATREGNATVRRRPARPTPLLELMAIDRGSVWRSVPLRRGFFVLLVLPGVAAAIAGLTWQSLILLPGLVAAGAGLLFGINAFSLDSGGSTWLATLPGWPSPGFAAKTLVLAEAATLAVVAVIIGAAARAQPPASVADLTAAIGAALACIGVVVATGMRASLRQPHRAELKGSRDTPAPPGVMALHSVTLACLTTFTSLFFSAAALSRLWWLPLLLTVPVIAGCLLSLRSSHQAWLNPHVRGYVVATVSGG